MAWAKVNLYLHVTGRRADGYHLLDSLAVFPALGDVLHAEAGRALSLLVTGPFAGALNGEPDNLVLRAARRLAERAGVTRGARLVLQKNLPVASGIGGGSADAAAALRLLAALWQVPVPNGLAVELGADVPVCLASRPARMGGIGDALSRAPEMPDFGIVLANPGVAVSTPTVFRARAASNAGFSDAASLPLAWADATAMAADLAELRNDLQASAIAIQPAIGDLLRVLAALPGARLARMSGSGATCFALFDDAAAARAAAGLLGCADCWSWGGAGLAPTAGDT